MPWTAQIGKIPISRSWAGHAWKDDGSRYNPLWKDFSHSSALEDRALPPERCDWTSKNRRIPWTGTMRLDTKNHQFIVLNHTFLSFSASFICTEFGDCWTAVLTQAFGSGYWITEADCIFCWWARWLYCVSQVLRFLSSTEVKIIGGAGSISLAAPTFFLIYSPSWSNWSFGIGSYAWCLISLAVTGTLFGGAFPWSGCFRSSLGSIFWNNSTKRIDCTF